MLPKSAFASDAEYLAYLRDWFAGQALAGLMALSSDAALKVYGEEGERRGETRMSETYAREAYEAADAMLAERERQHD